MSVCTRVLGHVPGKFLSKVDASLYYPCLLQLSPFVYSVRNGHYKILLLISGNYSVGRFITSVNER